MKIVDRKISELLQAQYNPRVISEQQMQHLKKSLETFDCVEPAVINKNPDRINTIVGGHQRIKAAKLLGWKEFPCVEVDLPLEKEKELNVRLNKNTGAFDFKTLEDEFDLDDLLDWGFEEDEFDFEIDVIAPADGEDDAPAVSESPISKLGDVWILGNHRVMCGDSTLVDSVEILMDSKKADMVFTDPPYGVSYQSNMREKSEKFDVIKNDDEFLDIVPIIEIFSNGFVFIWSTWKVIDKWIDKTSGLGFPTNVIVWSKGGGGIGDLKKTFSTDWELSLVWHRGAELTGKRIGSVWEIGKDSASKYQHPTQKPVALAEEALDKCSKRKDIILDLFLGSGSTLIAAEKMNRKCYGMELDPRYVDVILKRWQTFTGLDAVHDETGKTFSEMSE